MVGVNHTSVNGLGNEARFVLSAPPFLASPKDGDTQAVSDIGPKRAGLTVRPSPSISEKCAMPAFGGLAGRKRWVDVNSIRYVDELGPYRVVRAPYFEAPLSPRQGTRPTGLVVEFTAPDWKKRRTYAVFRKETDDAAESTYWIRIGRATAGEKFFLRPPVKVVG